MSICEFGSQIVINFKIAYYSLSTIQKSSKQKGCEDFMYSINPFLPSDSSLQLKSTDATPCPSSPLDAVISALEAFLDELSRKTFVRMTHKMNILVIKKEFDSTVFCEKFRTISDCKMIMEKIVRACHRTAVSKNQSSRLLGMMFLREEQQCI